MDGYDEKPIQTVTSKYGLGHENDLAQSQAETDRNDRPEDQTINPEKSIVVQDADTQTHGNLIREEDQSSLEIEKPQKRKKSKE